MSDKDLEELFQTAGGSVEDALDGEPPELASIGSFCSKDGKIWSTAPPTSYRTRAHNIPAVGRAGPVSGTIRNPVTIFKSLITPEIVSIIVRETNRKAIKQCRL